MGYRSLGDLNVTNKPNKLVFLKINRLSMYLEYTLRLVTNKTNKQTTFLKINRLSKCLEYTLGLVVSRDNPPGRDVDAFNTINPKTPLTLVPCMRS